MTFAVIESGGKQFKVIQGEIVNVPSIDRPIGQSVEFSVLAYGDADGTQIGSPALEAIKVTGAINGHGRDRKVIVFKKKRRKQYKKTHGHRQNFTSVRIESIG
ncbi:MAG: 50S ribosomal protein L21 [Blastocatellia bacterium AA13]|nr:MAG: 50S ribosomal protein L21 [Blastocatellia bacterium AA13]